MSINSIRLGDTAYGIVTKTVHTTLPGGGGGLGGIGVGGLGGGGGSFLGGLSLHLTLSFTGRTIRHCTTNNQSSLYVYIRFSYTHQ